MALRSLFVASSIACVAAQAGPGAPANGDGIQVWQCDSSSPRQQWLVETTNTFPRAHITLGKSYNATNDRWLVLDIADWSNATGASTHAWYNSTGNSGYNEQWSFGGNGAIISRMNGHCLTVSSGISGVAAAMQNCSSPPTPFQTWSYTPLTGLMSLAASPDVCLDAGSAVNCSLPPLSGYPYCNPDASTEARIADLVPRILPEEFPQLLSNSNTGIARLGVPRIKFGECLHGPLVSCGAPFTDPATGYTSTGCPTSFPHLLLQVGRSRAEMERAAGDAAGPNCFGAGGDWVVCVRRLCCTPVSTFRLTTFRRRPSIAHSGSS
jgi:hypothetical protein